MIDIKDSAKECHRNWRIFVLVLTCKTMFMETILIATDFSPAAHNAAVYGLELAKYLNADVILCNAYQAIISTTDMVVAVTDKEVKESSEANLLKERRSLTVPNNVNVETIAEEGWACNAILSVAKRVNAKWIIAGIKGSGIQGRKLFGSTVTELSRHSNLPLILVPYNYSFKVPEIIALASDITDETDITVLEPLHEFGEKLHSKMYVVRVIKKGMDEVVEMLLRPTVLKWRYKDLKPTYEFEVDNNVAHAMNKFVKEHNVEMIVMIKQDHAFLERLFTKSNTKEMMFKSEVPLIILPNKPEKHYSAEENNSIGEKQSL
jgi:nucleotide-binding universal stress UspA family protein